MDNPQLLIAAYMLLLSLGLRIEQGVCQHYNHLKPIPSDTLPLVVLKEDPNTLLDPQEQDLNETELRSILGVGFDAQFMSVGAPEEKGGELASDPPVWPKPTGAMPSEIKSIDFEGHHGKKYKPGKKLRRRIQLWLWSYTLCPVVHTWNDLGIRFWPRYVKVGSCFKKRSCSIPEGMVCRPAKTAHINILRWWCQQPHQQHQQQHHHRRSTHLKCAWIPVLYPIISECKCSCPSGDSPLPRPQTLGIVPYIS